MTYSTERFFVSHKVYNESCRGYEEQFHGCVIERDKVHK